MNRHFALLIFLFTLRSLGAVTPIEHFHGLVAGGNDPGYQDGSFTEARFNNIGGLAFDAKGGRLYVADSSNRRIRVIDLDLDDRVWTLAGCDAQGVSDGPLLKATFFYPLKLACLPGDKLAVYESGIHSVRLIDLQGQKVSTIARDLDATDMVYRPADDCLYFSIRGGHKIRKLDMKTLKVSDVLKDNPLLPDPWALCLHDGNICASDLRLPTVYALLDATGPPSATASAPLTALGDAKDVLSLTSSDGVLYALQRGGLLCRISPKGPSPLQFPTPWGMFFQNTDFPEMPLFQVKEDLPPGFSASPREDRKLFIAAKNSVLYLKDYHFDERWGAMEDRYNALTDFDYPARKPPRTFRILMTGSSRNSTSVPIPSDPKQGISEEIQSPKVFVYSKQLELLLNTEAALRGSKVHFEVLNYTHRHDTLSSRAYYEYPGLVQKYDIDLVLSAGEWPGYANYYTRPITGEGIPALTADHDYLSKPLSERATTPVARDLIARARALKIPLSEKQDYPGDGRWDLYRQGDEQVRDDLLEMTGRPIRLFQDKLDSMRTSEGRTPRFLIYYFPFSEFPEPYVESFWQGVCGRFHLDFLDLTAPYEALNDTYYPTARGHLTAYGNGMMALLLEHYLIENKLISF